MSSNRIEIEKVDLNLKFHPWTLLPSLTANTGFNTSFGRRVDPFTNTFTTNTVNSQSFGLNTSVPVFNGFKYLCIKNNYIVEKQKSELYLSQKLNDLLLQTTEIYVELCKIQIQKDLVRKRIESFHQIQGIQRLLIKEGKINEADTLRSHNSLLNEEVALLNILNELKLKTIDLNYQIGLPLVSIHSLKISSISLITETILNNEDFEKNIVGLELILAEQQIRIERSRILPSLNVSGTVGTGYSTNNKDYSIPGNPVYPYQEQINKNLYEGIGINLSVPLFNQGTFIKSKQLSEITMKELHEKEKIIELEREKRKIQDDHQLLFLSALVLQQIDLNRNLQTIYEKTLLTYKEGKIAYKDVETAFMDWQLKLIEKETTELSISLVRLKLDRW